eukprot:gene12740-3467_t
MSGLGRGGRGALLLKALEKPVKLPGQPAPGQQQQQEQQPQEAKPTETDAAQKSLPVGRGISSQLMAQTASAASQPPPAAESKPPVESMSKMTIQEPKITKKMEKGTAGAEVPVVANYIPIKATFGGAYQYAVSYSPDIESKSIRYQLLNEHRDVIGKTRAFDGAVLFLPKKLDEDTKMLTSTRKTDGAEIRLTITFVKHLDPEDRQCMQLYNIMFRRVMRILEMSQVGRYYYNPNQPVPIPQHKLELWPGYITAIEHYEGGLMLLADVSHRLLRTESVLQFMYAFYQKKPQNFQSEVTKKLVGNIVLTRYNNKTYRIDDIAWDKNPQNKFVFHSGEEMSYIDYYAKSYNKKIDDIDQPLLIHRPKPMKGQKAPANEVICLIPELCSMTGLTDEIRSDFRVMKDISSHTRVSPGDREKSMKNFVSNIYSNEKALEELMNWGLELDRNLLQLQGRNLPAEKILLGSTSFTANREADWGREATRENVISAVNLNNWIVIYTKRDEAKAMDFCNTMGKVAPAMGIQVSQPMNVHLKDERTETYLKAIRDNLNPKVQMVVTIFPTSRDDRYAAVKKLCCVESPVPSQCINARTISQANKLRSVTQKIALQINCKLGGELWALEIPMRSVMVVGIDVYHDGGKGGRSIGGFVASTNKTFTRWYSRVCFQQPGQELIDGLKVCFTASLRKYHEVNHDLPERIIVYRDGVGDGQLHVVANYEVQQFSDCFALFGESYKPKMAVIVVQKRINMRIFAATSQGGKLDNPPPGSVVDHTVTRKDWFDFFLVSQHVRQGTVSPTHYVVVHDELSYKLTHLYYNWPGTVRVPAPCQLSCHYPSEDVRRSCCSLEREFGDASLVASIFVFR